MSAFFQFLVQEWYFALPMLGLSFVALTLVFWRLLLNFEASTVMDVFLPDFQEVLAREGSAGALRLCRAQRGLIPRRLFVAGLESSLLGLGAMRQAMAHAVEVEILPELRFLLAPILSIAKIATMVGLLGTVISMIDTFTAISAGEGLAANRAGSIGLALFATALGLIIAIPLVFAHVLFRAWLQRFEVQLKSSAQKLLVLVEALRHPPAGSLPAFPNPPPVRQTLRHRVPPAASPPQG